VTMVIVLALMLIPLMGFLGLEKLLDSGWSRENQKKLFIAAGISIGTAFFVLLVTSPPTVDGIQKVFSEVLENDRKAIIQSDVFRSIFFVFITFGAIYFMLKGKITSTTFGIILALIILFDLGLVNSRYLNDSVYKRPGGKTYLDKTAADAVILEDAELDFRVLNLQGPFNEARTSFFHKSVGGYHGAKIRRYSDVISQHLSPEIQQIIKDQGLNKENCGVISMLNVKYLLAGYEANSVIRNPYANSAAWIVDEIKTVNSPDEEIIEIGNVDLRSTAVIDQSKFSIGPIQHDSTAQIKLVHYQPNKLVYESESNGNVLAVFSEIYYPKGWKAFVDGNEANILRVNYILRALELPKGNRNIEFRFEPKSFFIGNTIMWICSFILLGVLVFILARVYYFQKQY
jgi:hypothetical protein